MVNRLAYSLRNIHLTERQNEIVLGHILGDGYLSDPKRSGPQYNLNSYLVIDRKASDLPYLSWTSAELDPFIGNIKFYNRKKDGLPLVRFQTPAHPDLSALRSVWYPDGKKIVDPLLSIKPTSLMLAVWYMDDGTYAKDRTHEYCFLCTEGFGRDAQWKISDWLFSHTGIITTQVETGFGGLRIRIGKKEVRKFLDLIAPNIHHTMRYKLGC